jgi:hypothetical protein
MEENSRREGRFLAIGTAISRGYGRLERRSGTEDVHEEVAILEAHHARWPVLLVLAMMFVGNTPLPLDD